MNSYAEMRGRQTARQGLQVPPLLQSKKEMATRIPFRGYQREYRAILILLLVGNPANERFYITTTFLDVTIQFSDRAVKALKLVLCT